MDILSNNSKTEKSVNLPIEMTCDRSCPFYGEGCYGKKGRCAMKNAVDANISRYMLFKSDPNQYFHNLSVEIHKQYDKGLDHIRIFGVGDMPSTVYASKLFMMAYSMPQISFWISSYKMHDLGVWGGFVESINKLPNALVRISWQPWKGRGRYKYTSSVTDDPAKATCPCVKGSDMNCRKCGWKCWSKDVKHQTYLKH